MAESDKCKTCVFWMKDGTCKRYPPYAVVKMDSLTDARIIWPQTDKNDWCGEWKKA